MLWRLIRSGLAPHRRALSVIVVLQLVSTIASLYLPNLNADIIDHGVAKGDTGYIMAVGAVMLAISVVQIAASVYAVYLAARIAMAYGRDTRAAVFHRVGEFDSPVDGPSTLSTTYELTALKTAGSPDRGAILTAANAQAAINTAA